MSFSLPHSPLSFSSSSLSLSFWLSHFSWLTCILVPQTCSIEFQYFHSPTVAMAVFGLLSTGLQILRALWSSWSSKLVSRSRARFLSSRESVFSIRRSMLVRMPGASTSPAIWIEHSHAWSSATKLEVTAFRIIGAEHRPQWNEKNQVIPQNKNSVKRKVFIIRQLRIYLRHYLNTEANIEAKRHYYRIQTFCIEVTLLVWSEDYAPTSSHAMMSMVRSLAYIFK